MTLQSDVPNRAATDSDAHKNICKAYLAKAAQNKALIAAVAAAFFYQTPPTITVN